VLAAPPVFLDRSLQPLELRERGTFVERRLRMILTWHDV
jgi:hypothetical protein